MDSEIKIIISFLFNRSGKKQMTFSEIYLNLSMDLDWFTPVDAKKFIDYALKNKFLTKKGKLIEPNIDLSKIIIPVGFSPSKKLEFKEKNRYIVKHEDLLDEIINRIVEKTNLNYEEIKEKIKSSSKEKNLLDEIVALLFAKEYEIDLEELYEEIENKILYPPSMQ